MSAIVLVPPAQVALANSLAEGIGWGPQNFTGDLAFADPVPREVVFIGLHLTEEAFAGFSAALAEQPETAALLTGMRVELPATDENGRPVEFGPTHVAGICAREGWQVTRWSAS